MTALTNAAETALLTLLFINGNWANIGDATGLQGSSVAGSFYFSGHTSSPGETGSQTTNEISYTGYARGAVARSGSGFTVTNDSVSPDADISLGQRSDAGSATITDGGIGTASSGAGNLILYGDVSPDIVVGQNVEPFFTTASAVTAA